MLAYKITGDTSFECREITQEEAEALRKQGYFIALEPINWKDKMYVDGVVQDRPKPSEPEIPIPTPAELKRQKIAELKAEYDPQFTQLDNDAIAAKVLQGDTELFTTVMSERTALTTEYIKKLEAITNG